MREQTIKDYDVVIIGSGPTGMFAAMELAKSQKELKIAIIEQGPHRTYGENQNKTFGWGGAGAFSDGKITLSPSIGGQLKDFITEENFLNLMEYVKESYLNFLPNKKNTLLIRPDNEKIKEIHKTALANDLQLITFPILHLGTENAFVIVENIKQWLFEKKVDIYLNTIASSLDPPYVHIGEYDILRAKKIIVSPGRFGAQWMNDQALKLNLKLKNNGVDIGVRVETRAEILQSLTDLLYEPKVIYYSKTFDDKVRTFCVCPYGFVTLEDYHGLVTVNGHSFSEKKSLNTNFSILVTEKFTEPFDNPALYGKSVSILANLLGKNVLVQRLGDLKDGRRSTKERIEKSMVQPTLKEATPGDLSLVIPYRQMTDILEMIEALNSIMPGISSKHTLLYGMEVKFYSGQVETRGPSFETLIDGLYVAGDGSGYTRGLLQASMQGVIVAQDIISKI